MEINVNRLGEICRHAQTDLRTCSRVCVWLRSAEASLNIAPATHPRGSMKEMSQACGRDCLRQGREGPEKKNLQPQPQQPSFKSHVHHGNVMEIYNGFSAQKRSDPEWYIYINYIILDSRQCNIYIYNTITAYCAT